jgi:predicted ATPase
MDRAQEVKPDFQVTAANSGALAALCTRLEGIPLALELAAARAQMLSPMQMLAQLDHRFDFLVSRRRDIAERQRTLRAAIDWSYRLLPPELQRLFQRLSRRLGSGSGGGGLRRGRHSSRKAGSKEGRKGFNGNSELGNRG